MANKSQTIDDGIPAIPPELEDLFDEDLEPAGRNPDNDDEDDDGEHDEYELLVYERLQWGDPNGQGPTQSTPEEILEDVADAFKTFASRRLATNAKLSYKEVLRRWKSSRKKNNGGVLDPTNEENTAEPSPELLELTQKRWQSLGASA